MRRTNTISGFSFGKFISLLTIVALLAFGFKLVNEKTGGRYSNKLRWLFHKKEAVQVFTKKSIESPDLKFSSYGKYSQLAMEIESPEDRRKYGVYFDYGFRDQAEYREAKNIPNGFWVYVYPKWYVWRRMGEISAGDYTSH